MSKKTTSKRVALAAAEGSVLVPQDARSRVVQLLIPDEPDIGIMIDERPATEGNFEYKWCPVHVGPVTIELGPGQYVMGVAFKDHAIVTVLTTFDTED